jgi:hypothetical protein
MSEVLKILLMVLLSSVKYVLAVVPLLASSSRAWYLDMSIVMIGGCLGVFVFTYLGVIISKYLERFHFFRIKYKSLKRFIRIKNSYGLIGIAFLSPVLISIPVGCIISASFEHDKKRIIRLQILSVIFWSIFLFGLKGLFNINVVKVI